MTLDELVEKRSCSCSGCLRDDIRAYIEERFGPLMDNVPSSLILDALRKDKLSICAKRYEEVLARARKE